MGARFQTARELGHAAGQLALAPARVLRYTGARARLAEAVAADLDRPGPVDTPPPLDEGALARLRARPLRVFVSCAEPSGEQHALSLVRSLRARLAALDAPAPELVGLGGERLAAEGVRLVGDPVARAAMGADVLRALPFYLRLVSGAAEALAAPPPDVFVPVDSPALHVPLGRIARRLGVPVVHFVTPQYWAWAPWRVASYRSAVDRALTILPFEPAWFARHGVPAAHVGHPLLDALTDVPPSAPAEELPPGRPPRVALLPGSRESVVRRNLPWMLACLARVRRDLPALEVVLPHDRGELRPLLAEALGAGGAADSVELAGAGLHATLAGVDAALSVSGTVLLDLLHHRLPAVVVYRLERAWMARLQDRALTVPYFSSTNLLAGDEVCPEYAFAGDGPLEEAAEDLRALLVDPVRRREALRGLERAAARLGPPGAADRAAGHALELALRGAASGPLRSRR